MYFKFYIVSDAGISNANLDLISQHSLLLKDKIVNITVMIIVESSVIEDVPVCALCA